MLIFISAIVFGLLSYYALIGVSPQEWVKGSRNHVSVLVLYISIVPSLIYQLSNRGAHLILNIIFPTIALSLSIIAIGRSGIIVSSIYFLGNIYFYLNNYKYKYASFLIISLGLLIFSYELKSSFELINDVYLYKINNRGVKLESRQEIIDYYLSKLNFFTLIFSLESLNLKEKMDLTLHNSYLCWHFKYGFFSFLILYISLRSFFKSLLRNKKLALILIVILTRSFTDQILLTEGILLGFPFILSLIMVNTKNKINLIQVI